MVTDEVFVIVGAGEAGGSAAQVLREEGFDGRLVLVGAEEHLPYERPPLSKSYLSGEPYKSEGSLQDQEWYDNQDIDLRLGRRAVSLDRSAREIVLDDDEWLRYDKLLIATGATPRRLDVPGANLGGVHYLRTLEDSQDLSHVLTAKAQVVVVGAGWIGLEVAATARGRDCRVTVIEPNDVPLKAAMGAQIGGFFADVHRQHGVEFEFGRTVTELRGHENVESVVMDDGREIGADLVVVGIGVHPVVGLSEADLLADDGGARVDTQMRTEDPDVFVAGDIASVENPLYGRRIRVEHWANALMDGQIAARSMMGHASEFDPAPFFFTDQYNIGMEYAGWAPAHSADPLIRGDLEAQAFHAFWLSDDVVVAGLHVNMWDEGIMPVQKLIRGKVRVDRDRLVDPAVPLVDLIP
jgi:3-phenylpropionate/trans-cinnamate dioxygenase ferredoxin reductase component